MLNSTGTTKGLRVEEIPKDELHLAEDEALIHVAHFHKVNWQLIHCHLVVLGWIL